MKYKYEGIYFGDQVQNRITKICGIVVGVQIYATTMPNEHIVVFKLATPKTERFAEFVGQLSDASSKPEFLDVIESDERIRIPIDVESKFDLGDYIRHMWKANISGPISLIEFRYNKAVTYDVIRDTSSISINERNVILDSKRDNFFLNRRAIGGVGFTN